MADIPGMGLVFVVADEPTETIITATLATVVGASTKAASGLVRGHWQLVVDGMAVHTQTVRFGGLVESPETRPPGSLYCNDSTVSLSWAALLEPGTHEAKVQWMVSRITTGTGTIHAGVLDRTLVAQQLKR